MEHGPSQPARDRLPPWHSLAFLIFFSVVYGVEVSYKFATRQVIFLLNCCHVLTVTNILVLAAYVGGRAQSPAWQVLIENRTLDTWDPLLMFFTQSC